MEKVTAMRQVQRKMAIKRMLVCPFLKDGVVQRKRRESRTIIDKNQWNPNFSSERRSYEAGSHATGPAYYYPQYYPNNVPVYVATGDGRGGGSGTGYRRRDGWNSYVPSSSIWTTERSYSEQYRPNTVASHRTPSWKPCYCMTSAVDNRRRRENTHVMKEAPQPTNTVLNVVDAKLAKPFSNN
uniref:Uncharacterized protein n=1 Tax=Bactrocera latifrons TaxID=174628 RepID=A0A0K8UFB0_BACLA